MGKEIKEAATIVGNKGRKKGLKFLHKIDFFASCMLLIHCFVLPLVLTSVSNIFVYMSIPHELMVQGPVMFNLSHPDPRVKPLICNPHYKNFRENYLTEEMTSYKKVKNLEFLNRTEIKELVAAVNDAQNRTYSAFGITNSGIFQLLPPTDEWGGNMAYADMVANCMEGDCGKDPNLCFWKNASIILFTSYGQALFYLISVVLTCVIMYDPPPAGCRRCIRPMVLALSYLSAGLCGVIGMAVVAIDIGKYAPQVMYDNYSQFYVGTDTGYQCFLFAGLSSIGFGLLFMYLALFSPKYPRQKNRWDVRRHNFERSLVHIAEKAKTTE